MPIKKLRPEFTFTEDRLSELQQVVPEAFADGKVNWNILRESLGEYLEDETQEPFGLTWPGKREARRLAVMPSKGTLVPQPGEGINEENARNIFIEGENLEVLKLLQKSYAGRVKMIYIDPPYNTGNDFIYSDDYTEPLDSYLRRMGQKDEEGQLLTTNTRASGRFHSRWLSMMLPRLLIARSLLEEDGIVFISIDDNEFASLRLLCNEVFGEEQFVGCLTWTKKTKPINSGDAKFQIQSNIEYILVFSKARQNSNVYKFILEKQGERKYEHQGRYGLCRLKDILDSDVGTKQRDTMKFPILGVTPPEGSRWKIGKNEADRLLSEGKLVVVDGKVKIEVYPDDEDSDILKPFWSHLGNVGTAEDGKRELRTILNKAVGFDTVKPTSLIKELLIHLPKDLLVLDFFSGSGTTAHAVLEQNSQDGGTRKFIMVQFPEPTGDSEFPTIAELGKKRIRRVVANLAKGPSPKHEGFVSFALQASQFKEWEIKGSVMPEQLEIQFTYSENSLKTGWEPHSLIAELVLLEGFPLDSKIEYQENFLRNKVYKVFHEWHAHSLFVCLDEKVNPLTADNLKLSSGDIFICLDTALADESKLRLADQVNLHVI